MELYAYISGEPFYRIEIAQIFFARIVEFSKNRLPGVPDWIDLGPSSATSRRIIAAADPEWFQRQDDQ